MSVSKKILNDALRIKYLERVSEFLKKENEDVQIVGSNEIAMPCVDDDGNDEWMVITFKVPSGSRDGEIYDGYSMAEDYKLKCEEKIAKAKESAEKKAKKIAKDKAIRDAKAKAKAEREKGE